MANLADMADLADLADLVDKCNDIIIYLKGSFPKQFPQDFT